MWQHKITAVIFVIILFLHGALTVVYLPSLSGTYTQALPSQATVLDKVKTVIDTVNTGVNTILLKNKGFIEINGGFQRAIGRTVVDDAEQRYQVVKMDNGQITFTSQCYDEASEQLAMQSADNLIAFKDYLAQKQIPLLYIEAPTKVDPTDPSLPVGITDYTYASGVVFRQKIADAGLDYMIINDDFKNAGLNHEAQFFNTDHHWTPKAAFWTFGQLCEKLNQSYGFQIDPTLTDLSNYNIQTYANYFLGSQGKRVGTLYSGLDDIDLITPKFDTDLTFELPWHGISKTGAFSETVIDMSHISERDLYEKNPYAMYTGGDFPINIITNANEKDKKILLLRDSFGCALVPFLSLACHELEILDLRYYDHSTIDYVEATNPDMVIVMYNASAYYIQEAFQFDQ